MSNYDQIKSWRQATKLRMVESFGGDITTYKNEPEPVIIEYDDMDAFNMPDTIKGPYDSKKEAEKHL